MLELDLRRKKVELQESLTSLKASHVALEVQLDNLKNSTTTTSNDACLSSNASTSNGCARCYKIDISACATNLAEMSAMKKGIERLSNSLLNEKKEEPKKEEEVKAEEIVEDNFIVELDESHVISTAIN